MKKFYLSRMLILTLVAMLATVSVVLAAVGLKPKFSVSKFKMKLGDTLLISAFLEAEDFNIDNFKSSRTDTVKIINSREIKAVATGASLLTYTYFNGEKDVVLYCDVEVTRDGATYSPIGSDVSEKINITLQLDDYQVVVEGKGGAIPSLPTVNKAGLYFEGWYKDSALTIKLGAKDRLSKDTTLYPKWQTEEEKNAVTIYPSTLYDDITYHWGRNAIESVSFLGLFSGVEDRVFGPDLPMTRAMAITVLGRLDKANTEGLNSKATDIKQDSYYAGYLAWAEENKIVELKDGKFRPDDAIIREEMAVMIANYIKFKKIEYKIEDVSFSDKADISVDALDSVRMLATLGIMNGNADGTYAPKQETTRAQIAQIFYNYNNFINK